MKNKTHKGLLKRIRISKSGKVRHRTAGHKHLRSGKGGKRLRQMRKNPFIADADAKRLEKLLFRRLRGRTQPRTALRKSPTPAERKAAQAQKRAAAKAAAAGKAASSK
jgi:large subunit ribosomal protein L35